MMKSFFEDFIGLGIKYTICLILAFPMIWLIKWEAPSLDDVFNWQIFRVFVAMWLLSALGAWLLNRD